MDEIVLTRNQRTGPLELEMPKGVVIEILGVSDGQIQVECLNPERRGEFDSIPLDDSPTLKFLATLSAGAKVLLMYQGDGDDRKYIASTKLGDFDHGFQGII